jgi:hypothetical protein
MVSDDSTSKVMVLPVTREKLVSVVAMISARRKLTSLDKDLHATTKTENQVQSRLLLNIIVRESATVLKLLSGEDQTLLIRRNALLVLDLALDIVNGVGRLHLKGDGLSSKGLDDCVMLADAQS